MTTTEGALRLWTEIVRGLQAAGYSRVVPEYLKLSRVLAQVRMTELLQGQAEAGHWSELRRLAAEALESLNPLVEAARILAELPTEIRGIHEVAPAAESVEQPEVQGTAILLANETIVSDVPAKTLRRTKAVRKPSSSKPGMPAKTKSRKSAVSKPKARAKRRAH